MSTGAGGGAVGIGGGGVSESGAVGLGLLPTTSDGLMAGGGMIPQVILLERCSIACCVNYY